MNPRIKEETLDPEDWDALRALGHHMLDDMIDYHKTVRDRPIWKPFTDKLALLKEKVPRNPQGAEKVYRDFQDIILDANPGATLHPRFWGWVVGTGTPFGMLAEMLTASLNLDSIGSLFISYPVEKQVLEWFKEIFGYPREASGILVSGCSMANLVGLTVARNNLCEYDIRKYGLKHSPKKMTIYCSSETHSSIQKAVELLGLGSESLRYIPVNEAFQIDLQGLKKSIIEDRDAGNQPFCVVGNAGTVNTGAFDDLNLLAGICKKENLWFHVDGAFGAWTVIAPKLRHLVAGLAKADSLAFDLHKWMNLPYEIGCVLVRNEATHRHTFSLTPEYLERTRTELDENLPVPFREYGIQLSRSFRALKAWMCFKKHGIEKYGRLIQQNVDQARYLANLVDEAPELERFAPVSLNIVCFRYKTEELNDEQLNELNDKLLSTLRYNGIAILSNTTIDGKFVLRACNVNHRTKYEDMEFLVQEIIKLGHMLKDPEAL